MNRANFRSTGLFADPDVGLGFGSSDYPDMSMTAIPGATTPDDIQLESGPALSLVNPGNRGFEPEGTQIAPEAATVTPTENFESTASQMQANIFDPSGGETDEGTRFAYPKESRVVPTPEDKFGNQQIAQALILKRINTDLQLTLRKLLICKKL